MAAKRKSIDCGDYPSEKNCSLKISGTQEEVPDAAMQHAVSARTRRDAGIARADRIDAKRRAELARRGGKQINVALMPAPAFHSAHLHLGFSLQLGEQLL